MTANGVHFTNFAAEYETILARAQRAAGQVPPPLCDLAAPLLPELGAGTFARIVALLPYWIGDLLDAPASASTQTLGLANLLGWWAYRLQDGILDAEADDLRLLPLSMAFHGAAVARLARLLPAHEAFWVEFEALSLSTAAADAWGLGCRFGAWAELDEPGRDDDCFGFDDPERLAGRSALLLLAVAAQLALHGRSPHDPLARALGEALRQLAIGRQIGDDLADWAADLERGRLNYVSARIARRMKDTGAVEAYAELDPARMAGFWIYDDALLDEIQAAALAAYRRAGECLASTGKAGYLAALIDDLAAQARDNYQAGRDRRQDLRAALSPLR